MAFYQDNMAILNIIKSEDINEPSNEPKAIANSVKSKSAFANFKSTAIGIGAIRTVKATTNFLTSNYGAIMQDSVAQAKINTALEISSIGLGVGAGFIFGGIAGGALALLSVGINTANKEFQRKLEQERSRASSIVMYERVGLSSKGGGRG